MHRQFRRYIFIFFIFIINKSVYGQSYQMSGLLDSLKLKSCDTAYIKLLNKGSINFYGKDLIDSAIYYCQKTIETCNTENIHIARTYNILANCYSVKGAYTIVLDNYFKALKIYEKFSYLPGIANTNNNIGNTYKNNGYYDKAIQFHEKALAIRKEINDIYNIALSYNNMANVYHSMRQYDKAIDYHVKSMKIKEELDDTMAIIISLNNLGGLYADIDKPDEAIKLLERSNFLMKCVKTNKQDFGINYVNIAKAYYKAKDYAKAEKFSLEAIKLSDEIGDFETKIEACNLLTSLYKEKNDIKKAFYYLEAYISLKDSVFNSENAKRLLNEQLEYDYNKKAEIEKEERIKQEAKTEAERQRQKQALILLSVVLVLILAFSLFMFKAYKDKQKINEQITLQNEIIQDKQKQIIDSINYAKRIQTAILPETSLFINSFSDAFVLYLPKDIVSGDLYWFAELTTTTENPIKLKVAAVADCTGHGVPGAFMSMLSVQLMNESIKNPSINSPSELLAHMNRRILIDLQKNENLKVKDGLDIAVCAFDYNKNVLYYSGANRPLWVLKEGVINEYKPTKASIGGFTDNNQVYENNTISLSSGDRVFMFTDGITDQFGGTSDKKFTKARLKSLIEQNSSLDLKNLHYKIEQEILSWKGNTEQTDDILILGFKV